MSTTSRRLALAAGWIGITFGAAHTVVAPLDTPVGWREILSDGWWGAFTLDRSSTLADFRYAETFWISLGSFGAPMLVLGALIVWVTKQGVRVPGWVGYSLMGWGLALSTALPVSPGWAVPLMGALLVLADVARKRAEPALPAADRLAKEPASTS